MERISEPAEASYLEGGTERNAQSGSLDAATVVLGVRGGIFGEWELARRTWLRAELAGTRGLTSLLDSVELTTGTLRLSLSITWSADGDSTPIKAED